MLKLRLLINFPLSIYYNAVQLGLYNYGCILHSDLFSFMHGIDYSIHKVIWFSWNEKTLLPLANIIFCSFFILGSLFHNIYTFPFILLLYFRVLQFCSSLSLLLKPSCMLLWLSHFYIYCTLFPLFIWF